MKITSRYKVSVLCATALTGALLLAPDFTPADISCQHIDTKSALQCMQDEQQSWFSWLRGESRSTQFHFVDLLELLNRLIPAN